MLEFVYPYLFALLPLPLLLRFVPDYQQQSDMVKVPFFHQILSVSGEKAKLGARSLKATRLQKIVLITSWLLLVTAAAKPQWLEQPFTQTKSARDLMVAVDASGSMSTTDFSLNKTTQVDRLTMVKSVLEQLATKRKNDRLGLIVFGSAAYLQMPFSEDHATWLTLLNELEIAIAGQSTVLGDAIGLAIKHFEESDTKNRVLILLTDGNDAGSKVPPVDAAKIAASFGVKIYTIAIGDPATLGEQKLDTKTLARIAEITGGGFYHAMDTQQLNNAYKSIAALEPQAYQSISFRPKTSMHHIPLVLMVLLNITMVIIIRLRINAEEQSYD
tara:strand:+ start:5664 stop:6650 length:987 start_codon:yes stop_codon:yes gene_type:complete